MLAFTFILVIATVSYAEPAIVDSIASDAPLPFLTAQEAAHMHDVHQLVRAGMIAATICLLYLVIYSQFRSIDKSLAKESFIMSIVLILFLIPFNTTFTWFHAAFFPNGNWQFSPDSWLITHFPESFFLTAAVTWLFCTAALLAALSRALPER